MATILVTGAGGTAGRAVARLLLDRGHTVIGVDMQAVQLAGVTCLQVPAASDPLFSSTLCRLAAEFQPALVIPTVGEELPVLARIRERWAIGTLAVGPCRAVAQANDTYHTCLRLASSDVPVPRFALPSHFRGPAALGEHLGWPCLSKPRVGRGGRGVQLHQAEDQLPYAGVDDRRLFQEFVPGPEYVPSVYLGERAIAVAVLEKTRLGAGPPGSAEAVRRVEAPDVAAVALAACRALGLRGAAAVDIRRRADGTPVVLEVKAHFGSSVAHAPEILDALLAETGLR